LDLHVDWNTEGRDNSSTGGCGAMVALGVV
jgi:hypothetical protein